jgi:hypothetical protein
MNVVEEVIKAVLTGVASWAVYYLTSRRPRLMYFLSGFTSCRMNGQQGPFVVWIYQITIQNTGKAPSRNVRVAHFHMPFSWQVIQTVTHNVEQVSGVDRIIRFDTIEPGMVITIAYMDTDYHRITTAHDHIRSDEGVVRQTPVQFYRIYPKPVLWALNGLIVVGVYTVISKLYDLIMWAWMLRSSTIP